jgi:hypothetical protein
MQTKSESGKFTVEQQIWNVVDTILMVCYYPEYNLKGVDDAVNDSLLNLEWLTDDARTRRVLRRVVIAQATCIHFETFLAGTEDARIDATLQKLMLGGRITEVRSDLAVEDPNKG